MIRNILNSRIRKHILTILGFVIVVILINIIRINNEQTLRFYYKHQELRIIYNFSYSHRSNIANNQKNFCVYDITNKTQKVYKNINLSFKLFFCFNQNYYGNK